jgi:hypothetical protein
MEGSTSAKSNEQDEAASTDQSSPIIMKKEIEGPDEEDDEDDSEEDQREGQDKEDEKGGGGSEQEDKKINESSSSGGAPREHDKPEGGNSAQQPSQQQQQQQSYPPPATPGAPPGAIPIQPYGYPPGYPYYHPMPGYAPNLASSPGGADPFHQMMAAASSPYGGYTDVSTSVDPAPDTRRNRGGVTEPFPEKLHRMLDNAERERTTDVVSFFSHGRAFAIHKPRRFVQEIMPRFFRQTRLTSFQRQLNLYGFRRISQGPDNGGTRPSWNEGLLFCRIGPSSHTTSFFARILSRAFSEGSPWTFREHEAHQSERKSKGSTGP